MTEVEAPVKASDGEPVPPEESESSPEESPAVATSDEPAAVVVVVESPPVVVVVVEPPPVVVVVAGAVVVVVPPGAVVVVVVVALEAVNVTVTSRALRSTPSVVSSALYFKDSAVESVTVKRAAPVSSVVPFMVVTVELPPKAVSVTTLPGTAFPFPSYSKIEIVEVVDPSAGTLAGVATTEQNAGTGGGAGGLPNVTTACCEKTWFPSVTSVAWYVTTSAVASVTVNNAWPALLVVAVEVAICEFPLRAFS
jgi:hypothetical protein